MKYLNRILLGLSIALSLTGCRRSNLKEVDYQTFHEMALEAYEKESGYVSASVNGNIDGSIIASYFPGEQTVYNLKNIKISNLNNGHVNLDELSGLSMLTMSREKIIAYSILSIEAHLVPEPPEGEEQYEIKYYAGKSGFKVEAKQEATNGFVKFNKYGLVTSFKATGDVQANVTIKWSK